MLGIVNQIHTNDTLTRKTNTTYLKKTLKKPRQIKLARLLFIYLRNINQQKFHHFRLLANEKNEIQPSLTVQ